MWTENIERYYEDESQPDAAPCRSIRSGLNAMLNAQLNEGDDHMAMTSMPLLKRTREGLATGDGAVAIEYLDEEVPLDGAAASLFGKHAPAPRRQDAASSRSPSGSGSRRRACARSPISCGRRRRSASATKPSGTMTGAEFYELHRKLLRATGCSRVYDAPAVGEADHRHGLARPGDRLRVREVPLHRGRLRAHGDRRRERHARDDAAPRASTSSRSTATATSTGKACAACSPTTSSCARSRCRARARWSTS